MFIFFIYFLSSKKLLQCLPNNFINSRNILFTTDVFCICKWRISFGYIWVIYWPSVVQKRELLIECFPSKINESYTFGLLFFNNKQLESSRYRKIILSRINQSYKAIVTKNSNKGVIPSVGTVSIRSGYSEAPPILEPYSPQLLKHRRWAPLYTRGHKLQKLIKCSREVEKVEFTKTLSGRWWIWWKVSQKSADSMKRWSDRLFRRETGWIARSKYLP